MSFCNIHISIFFIPLIIRSTLADAQDERDKIIHENERFKARHHKMIEAAIKDARVKERQHLSITIEKLKVKNSELSHSLTSLTNRAIDAEKEARSAAHQANQSTKQLKEILAKVEFLERELMVCKQQLARQCNENIDLELKLDDALNACTKANDAVPLRCLERFVKAILEIQDGLFMYGN